MFFFLLNVLFYFISRGKFQKLLENKNEKWKLPFHEQNQNVIYQKRKRNVILFKQKWKKKQICSFLHVIQFRLPVLNLPQQEIKIKRNISIDGKNHKKNTQTQSHNT